MTTSPLYYIEKVKVSPCARCRRRAMRTDDREEAVKWADKVVAEWRSEGFYGYCQLLCEGSVVEIYTRSWGKP